MNWVILLPSSFDRPRARDGLFRETVAGRSQPQRMLPCKFLGTAGKAREVCQEGSPAR